jgi:dihydroorotate dehydrogenase
MPDWSYRTIFRPLLFRLPADVARDLTLGLMRGLARLPFGAAVIDFLGHMRPDPRLTRSLLGVSFPTPVGLGPGIDANAVALSALARFGVGFVEVGPVTVDPIRGRVERWVDRQAIRWGDPPPNPGLAVVASRLAASAPLGVPLIVRLGHAPGADAAMAAAECRQMIAALNPLADLFSLSMPVAETWDDTRWCEFIEAAIRCSRETVPVRPVLLCIPPDVDAAAAEFRTRTALERGVGGVLIEGSVGDGGSGRLYGPAAHEPALRLVRHLRGRWGSRLAVISGGGVHEPRQALDLLDAGADLVQIDSGLVYAGPGLPKRVNEAVLAAHPSTKADDTRPPERDWFWAALLGISMLLGGGHRVDARRSAL